MSPSSTTVFRYMLDRRVLAAVVGVLSGAIAGYHGWQGGLVVFVTGLGLLFMVQWMERDTQRVIQRMKDPANIAP